MVCTLIAASMPLAPADLVIVNAKIWSSGAVQSADTIGVRGGKIVYVGKGGTALAGPSTRRVDAKGRYVVPGLIDSHTHLLEGGITLMQLQLQNAKSMKEFVQMVKSYADKLPKDKWIIGGGWSAESWPEKRQPTKETIDDACGGRPAMLKRMDGHSCLVNSAALKKLRFTNSTPGNPAGGVIDRDPQSGEPTGILRETAQSLVALAVPPPTADERLVGFRAAIKMANRLGVTAVSDISSIADWNLYKRVFEGTNPTMRFALYARAGDWQQTVDAVNSFVGIPNWVEPRGVKAFMDGSLGSRTAYMNAPFTSPLPGQKELRGVPMPGAVNGTYAKGFRIASDAGLQVIVHAIGDQANHDVLDLFSQSSRDVAAPRFRVEHAQHLLPADVARFGELGIIPSMQPFHKSDDGRYCDEVIGVERSKTSYAFRSLLDTGAKLAFGSDWPVVSIDPMLGVRAATTGYILTGKHWNTQQNISVDEALTCYTVNGAYAMKMENLLGRIEPGYAADIVIFESSPWEKNPKWDRLTPSHVFVGGNEVYPESGKNNR